MEAAQWRHLEALLMEAFNTPTLPEQLKDDIQITLEDLRPLIPREAASAGPNIGEQPQVQAPFQPAPSGSPPETAPTQAAPGSAQPVAESPAVVVEGAADAAGDSGGQPGRVQVRLRGEARTAVATIITQLGRYETLLHDIQAQLRLGDIHGVLSLLEAEIGP